MMKNAQKLFIIAGFILSFNSYKTIAQVLVSQFDFNSNLNDKLAVSTASLYNNASTSYLNGSLKWIANASNGGGGLLMDVPDASFTEKDYSISMDIRFSQTTGYRKIIDFFNMTDDDGLYFFTNLSMYIGGNNSGTTTINPNTYYTVLLTRNGADDTTRVYITNNNTLMFEAKTKDVTGKFIAALTGTNRNLGFFHDDNNGSEYADSGAVRSIRIWNGIVNIADVCNSVTNYTVTPATLNMCKGTSKTFTFGTSPDPAFKTYTFNPLGSTTYTAVITPTASTTYSLFGDYYSTGCFTPSSSISVTVTPGPTVTATQSSTLICSLTSVTLTASGATTFTWSTASTNTIIVVTPSVTTNYTVTGGSAGCTGSFVISQSVSPNPTVTAITSSSIICGPPFQQTSTLTANGAGTYTWNTASTNTSIAVSPSVTTNYTVTGTNGAGCIGTVVITQSVSACTNIQSLSNAKSLVGVFPNPNNGKFTVVLSSLSENSFVEVYNSLGQLVQSNKVNSLNEVVEMNHQPNGIYVVRVVENKNQVYVSKIIKE